MKAATNGSSAEFKDHQGADSGSLRTVKMPNSVLDYSSSKSPKNKLNRVKFVPNYSCDRKVTNNELYYKDMKMCQK